MKITVCMATYNGEKYIEQQLKSILRQLSEDDELIISDDNSSDTTIRIIERLKDKRIKLQKNQKFKSPIFNFENAIKYAIGDIIVLSDQDDIWKDNKIQIIKDNIKIDTVSFQMYNGNCIDANGKVIHKSLFDYIRIRYGLLQNIKKNSFIGCNIAFTKELLPFILPFPKNIPMHDMWIGSCAYLFGEVKFINNKIFSYRLHENNFTGRNTILIEKLKWRYSLIINLIIRYLSVKYKK
jgi:glycosyltransferase involved in cell wall biosynthesis